MIKTQIAIIGAAGRMGRMTFREVMADETAAVSGMLVRPGSPDEGSEVKLEDGRIFDKPADRHCRSGKRIRRSS